MSSKEKELLKEIKEALPHMSDEMKGVFKGAAMTLNDIHKKEVTNGRTKDDLR